MSSQKPEQWAFDASKIDDRYNWYWKSAYTRPVPAWYWPLWEYGATTVNHVGVSDTRGGGVPPSGSVGASQDWAYRGRDYGLQGNGGASGEFTNFGNIHELNRDNGRPSDCQPWSRCLL